MVGDIKKNDFYNFYKKITENPVDRSIYNKILKELLINYSESIVLENNALYIKGVGKIRIRSKKLHFFRKDGKKAHSLKPDWKKTKELWATKYPGLTPEELKQIKNKPLVYHTNEHSSGEFYEHFLENFSVPLKYKRFYKFKASRQYSRLLAKTVKDPERKIFYYG